MAATANLLMEQGATFLATIECVKADDTPYDLRGWSVRSQMRKTHAATTITATFTASHNGRGGIVSLSLTSTQTAEVSPGTYFYDVELYDDAVAPSVTRLIEGSITVSPEVTK